MVRFGLDTPGIFRERLCALYGSERNRGILGIFHGPGQHAFRDRDRFEFKLESPRREHSWCRSRLHRCGDSSGFLDFTRWRLEAQTSEHRPLQFGTTSWFGTFFNGHLTQWVNYLRLDIAEGESPAGPGNGK